MVQPPSRPNPPPLHLPASAPLQQELTSFIKKKNPQSKRHGEKPVFDRNLGSSQNGLKSGDIQPEEGHDEGEQDGREEVVIPGVLVEE